MQGSIISVPSSQPAAVSVNSLLTLPIDAQLLVAHALEHNNRILNVLTYDPDVRSLSLLNWVTPVINSSIGSATFEFIPRVWRQLQPLRPDFLTEKLLEQLADYRKRKSAFSPWVWW